MRGRRHWLKVALALTVAGLLVGGAALAWMGFDVTKLNTVHYVTTTHEVDGSFRDIAVLADDGQVALLPSQDGACRVVCREEEEAPYRVAVENGALTVEGTARDVFSIFRVSLMQAGPSITVYLPRGDYGALTVRGDAGDVSIPADFTFQSVDVTLDTGSASCLASAEGDIAIRTDTGRIAAADLAAAGMTLASDTGAIELSGLRLTGALELRQDTGRATLEDVTCDSLTSAGQTGDLRLTGVVAAGAFDLTRDTGDILFDGCDAGSIAVRTDTGDVTGTLLTDKVFAVHSDTGRVSVPETAAGGRCEITTDTGDIRMEVR